MIKFWEFPVESSLLAFISVWKYDVELLTESIHSDDYEKKFYICSLLNTYIQESASLWWTTLQ